MIYFITGNTKKVEEARSVLPDLEQLDIDLPEIQEMDSHEIIKAKLLAASEHHSGDFVVEDTSLCLECLGGLPGPLIKWFFKTIGADGIAEIAHKYENHKATAKVAIGYKSGDDISFFEGVVHGQIVQPRGNLDFAWGPTFQPDGFEETFGEMSREKKNSLSMRKVAFEALKEYLDNKEI